MIKHEIRCDICNEVVAIIKPQLFDRVSVCKKYIKCKGREIFGDKKITVHVCDECLLTIREKAKKKEQSK